jgi:hypothetical protein
VRGWSATAADDAGPLHGACIREGDFPRLGPQLLEELWRTDLRVVDTITEPEATARTLGSYIVERGEAGAQPA